MYVYLFYPVYLSYVGIIQIRFSGRNGITSPLSRLSPAPRQQYREEKRDLSDPDQQAAAGHDTREVKREPVRAEKTVGRNDLCPCGSGKKYKNCHGKND